MQNISSDSMGGAMVNHPLSEYDKMTVAIKKRTRGVAKNFRLLQLTITVLLLAAAFLLSATVLLKAAIE
ncbi:MAG: hypothetical protein AB9917_13365 [Negativicutes bacterium]